MSDRNVRDHLFVSYATEDSALAKWLALRLTAEGYKVWIDQFQLLGGEPYPRDIDRAIKQRTFRFLALLSRHSIEKPNPRRERTLALNLGTKRGEDFLIPLNVDGLSPTELDWMTGDLTFIPFRPSWAAGLGQLLRKLEQLETPRLVADGRSIVASRFLTKDVFTDEPEPLFSNLLPILETPTVLHRFRLSRAPASSEVRDLSSRWPFYLAESVDGITRRHYALAFEPPPKRKPPTLHFFREGGAAWREVDTVHELPAWQVVKPILRKTLILKFVEHGLGLSEDGKDLVFPFGSTKAISYVSATGRRVPLKVWGERTFRGKEKFRYELGFTVDVLRVPGIDLTAKLRLRIRITDADGRPLPSVSASVRRKSITRTWFNHEFGTRHLAVFSYLADLGHQIAAGHEQRLVLSAHPVSAEAPFGIRETALPKGRQMFRYRVEDEEADANDEENEDG